MDRATPTTRPTAPRPTATAGTAGNDLTGQAGSDAPRRYTYRVVKVYPHDPTAFTEGLVYHDGVFYESTGLYGRSALRRVTVGTGLVVKEHRLPWQFGEGLALHDGRLVQLTWRERMGFVYDRGSFELLDTFTYPTEGWGLTSDGRHLIMSDGTAVLRTLDPITFAETGRVTVYDDQGPVVRLNELEWVEGEILANVWLTDRIARIDPATGRVTGLIDLKGLLEPVGNTARVDVLNGIAYDADHNRLFVTGKWWPYVFQIELVRVR